MTEVGSDFGSADERLAALGYQPELIRTRSTWHVAFMSFVLASIPYGLTTTMYYSIANGGPVTVIWGWAAVSFFTLCVAISLAEIVSVFPCAGGVYYQTFMLSPPSYRKILSYICGWSFFVGNVTITLAVNFGTSLLWVACIQLFSADYLTETYQVYLIFVGVTLLCSAISTFGNRYLHILDTFAIFWTFAGTIAIVVVILALARNGRRSASYAFGHFEQGTSGWPAGWSFFVGLLQAAYASSSTGMIVSMCEEVAHPETQVPKAMVGTIGLNFICGMLFMIPLMFVLPNIADLLALPSGQPVPAILLSAVGGNAGGAFGLMVPILVLSILCGTGCTTAATRCTWAFARDGAIPGSKLWAKVNKTFDLPLNSMIFVTIVQLLLGLIYFGSPAAFNAFGGVGVVCLGLSYMVPIAVSFARGRSHVKRGKFYCGIIGTIANIVAIGWTILAIPLFCFPTLNHPTAQSMNYASVVFAFSIAASAAWYFVWGRKYYDGPPVDTDPSLAAAGIVRPTTEEEFAAIREKADKKI